MLLSNLNKKTWLFSVLPHHCYLIVIYISVYAGKIQQTGSYITLISPVKGISVEPIESCDRFRVALGQRQGVRRSFDRGHLYTAANIHQDLDIMVIVIQTSFVS